MAAEASHSQVVAAVHSLVVPVAVRVGFLADLPADL
jgi:hypothetical protein